MDGIYNIKNKKNRKKVLLIVIFITSILLLLPLLILNFLNFIYIFLIISLILFLIIIFFKGEGHLLQRRAIPMLILTSFLFPYIRLTGNMPDLRPEYIIIGLITFLILLVPQEKRLLGFKYLSTYKWFGLFFVSILLSISFSLIVKGIPFKSGDFFELVKLLIYFTFFLIVSNIDINYYHIVKYYKFILICFLISVIIGILQYLNVSIINKMITPYYAPSQAHGVIISKRITGTMDNPNAFGAFLTLAIIMSLAAILFAGDKVIKTMSGFFLPLFLFGQLLTQSRSSLITTLLSSIILIILYLKRENHAKLIKSILILIILIGLLILIINVLPKMAEYRLSEVFNIKNSLSWKARVESMKINYSLWSESPMFGWGPAKAIQTSIDNEWLFILRRYGIVGLFMFLGLIGSILKALLFIYKYCEDDITISLSSALISCLLGYLVFMFVAGIYHDMQFMSILLILIGITYTKGLRKVKDENTQYITYVHNAIR